MADTALLAAATVSSLLSLGLFLTGVSAWSTVYVNMYNIGWSFFGASISAAGQTANLGQAYLGLQGYYSVPASATGQPSNFYSWLSCAQGLTNSYCNQCQSAGEVSFALILTASILSFILLVTTINRIFANSYQWKVLAICSAFFAQLVAVTAFSNWHVQCYLAFQDNFFGKISSALSEGIAFNRTNYEYYGFNVVVVGWVFSLVSFVLHLVISAGDADATK